MIDLTPLEVRKKKGDFRRGLRGYDPSQVDDFLDIVADRLEALVRENNAFNERFTRLEQQVAEYREREKALTEALVTAQEMREEMRAQVAREADLARRQAEQDASRIRGEAVQTREREEDALRRLRARQMQFLQTYRTFLERELSELQSMARGLELNGAFNESLDAGRSSAGGPASPSYPGGDWATEPSEAAQPRATPGARTGEAQRPLEPLRVIDTSRRASPLRPGEPKRAPDTPRAPQPPHSRPPGPDAEWETSPGELEEWAPTPPPATPRSATSPPAASPSAVPPAASPAPRTPPSATAAKAGAGPSAPPPPRPGERTAFAAGMAGGALKVPPRAEPEPPRSEPRAPRASPPRPRDADVIEDDSWLAADEPELILSDADVLEEIDGAAPDDLDLELDMPAGGAAPPPSAPSAPVDAFGPEFDAGEDATPAAGAGGMLDALLSSELGNLPRPPKAHPPGQGPRPGGIGLDLVPEFESFSDFGDLDSIGDIGKSALPETKPQGNAPPGDAKPAEGRPDANDDPEDLLSSLFGDDR